MHAVVRGERLLGVPNSSPAKRRHEETQQKPELDQEDGRISDREEVFGEETAPQIARKPANAAFAALLILSLFMNIPISLIGPFFPNEAINHGVPLTAVGMILSAFPLSVFLSAPVWGLSVPFLGPKVLILGGGVMTSVCVASFSLIDNFQGFRFICFGIGIRLLQGIGCAATETGATAMLAGRFPESIGTITGLMDVAESIGFMVGPPIGGVLYQRGGFQAPFLVIGGATLVVMIPLIWLVPKRASHVHKFSDISVCRILQAPGVALVVLAAVLGMSVFAFLELALQPHFIGRNVTSSELGLLFTMISAVYAVCSPLVGYMTTPRNTRPFIVFGLLLIAFALCLLSGLLPLVGFGAQVVSLILMSAGCSCVLVPVVPSMTFAVLHLGSHAMDVVSGIITSSFSLGEILGPSIGGFLMQRFGFQVGTGIYACLILLVALALLLYILMSNTNDDTWPDLDELQEPLVDNQVINR